MDNETQDLLVSVSEGILTIKLNRPTEHNSLSQAMVLEMIDVVTSAEHDPHVRCILITANGSTFCSGGDLNSGPLTDPSADIATLMEEGINRLLITMERSPIPIICAVNGIAVGAGLGLALAGDIVIASRSAELYPSFSRLGISLDGGTSYFFTEGAGLARATAMCLLADRISSAEAHHAGLLWRIFDDDDLENEALNIAGRLAQRAPLALAAIKAQLSDSVGGNLSSCLSREVRDMSRMLKTEDFSEGLQSFQEKRKPRFTGR